eukprot:6184694-Pleurochrysis_carterae.AAC.2
MQCVLAECGGRDLTSHSMCARTRVRYACVRARVRAKRARVRERGACVTCVRVRVCVFVCLCVCGRAAVSHLRVCVCRQLLHGAPSELARESIAPPRAECERADQTSSTGKQKASTGKQKASTSEQEAGSGAKGPHSRRVTFLVNIWCNHKPWGAEKLPPKIAQKLSK